MTPYEIAEELGFKPGTHGYKAVLALSCGDFEDALDQCQGALDEKDLDADREAGVCAPYLCLE